MTTSGSDLPTQASPNVGSVDLLPTLQELGRDLLYVSPVRRVMTIGMPFAIMLSFVVSACLGW